MPTSPLSVVIQHLLTDLRPDGDGLTDGELLTRFVRSRDEDALAALVRRHASMVWGVCRRVLEHHDAEDAFQATFLVLVHKAKDVPGQAVANWLYGVARQTAVRLRATAAKRRRRESQVVNMPEPTVPEVRDTDLQIVLDEELSRLPDHYRGVIILCDLEGMTRKEAARQLGIPEGSVASRLARARALLAKRVTQRGIVFSGGSVLALLSAGASSSAPPALVASTIKVASLLAAGQAAGVVSGKVAALTEGMVKAMFMSKIKAVVSVVLILGFVAAGAMLPTYKTAAGQDDKKPTTEKPVNLIRPQPKDKDKDAFTAWGKEVGGLQMGLGYHPGEHRAYRPGETVKLVVRVRNVGKEAVKFSYIRQFSPNELLPTVTDGEGKQVSIEALVIDIKPKWRELTLTPGKASDLHELNLDLRPASESGNKSDLTLYGAGKFHLQHERMNGMFSPEQINLDPNLDRLATGKLELDVKDTVNSGEKR